MKKLKASYTLVLFLASYIVFAKDANALTLGGYNFSGRLLAGIVIGILIIVGIVYYMMKNKK